MSSTFSNLKFELIGNGEQSGTWGTTTNTNIGTAIEQAVVGMATLDSGDFTANVATLTLANTNAAQDARALCLNIGAGAVSAAGTINVPAIQKPYIIINGSSFTVTVKVSGQTGVAVPAGKRTVVYNNGTDVGSQIDWLASLDITTLNVTTVDATNVEVTNVKAKDGTAGMAIANSTGVVSFTANPILSGGTANGVVYANASKVLTTGAALTFDGTTLGTTGSLRVDGNTTLGNATSDTVTANGRFNTDVVPSTDNARDLGTTALKWRQVYATAFTENGFGLVSQTDIGSAPNKIPLNQYLGNLAYMNSNAVVINPVASAAPVGIGDMVFQLTDDTTLVVKVKGSDGTVRSATLTLA